MSIDDEGNTETIHDGWEGINHLTSFENKLYFEGEENTFENSLQRYDPLTEETDLLFEVNFFGIRDIEVFKDEIYLLARLDDGDHLIKTDGVGSDYSSVFFLNSGSSFSSNHNMTATDEKLFFFSSDADFDYALYASDGTTAGTNRVSGDFDNISFFDYIDRRAFIGFNSRFYFQGEKDNDRKLFSTDGSPGDLTEIEIIVGEESKPEFFTSYNNELYFKAFLGFYSPNQAMYKIDNTGLEANPALDGNLIGFNYDLDGGHLTIHNDLLYYSARSDNGSELWQSDGTENNTEMVSNLAPGNGNSFPSQITSSGENLFFFASPPASGKELYAYTSNIISSTHEKGQSATQVHLAPNPASSHIVLQFKDAEKIPSKLNIYSANGEKLLGDIWTKKSTSVSINIEPLTAGSYFIISEDLSVKEQFYKINN